MTVAAPPLHPKHTQRGAKILTVAEPERQPLTALEMFAGAGGLAVGVHQAGFQHLGLIEWDAHAAATLRLNSQKVLGHGPDLVFHSDARDVDYQQFAGKIDLLSGGPPCQPFSAGGASAGDNDPRNMFPVFLDVIKTTRPRAILIENVKGLLREKFKDYFEYLKLRVQFPFARINLDAPWDDQLVTLRAVKPSDFPDDERYILDVQLIDTADFGVPQRRERVIFMALRADLGLQPAPPAATHSKLTLLHDQWITGDYWTRHGIPPIENLNARDRGIRDALVASLLTTDGLLPWRTVRDAISDLPRPVERGEQPKIANHLQHPGARIYPPCHMGSFPDVPAKALKAGTHGTPGGENILHSAQEGVLRYFTTREAGRLQTFPDDWEFLGTWGACIKQLGNAVPVRLGEVYASAIHRQLLSLTPPCLATR